MAQNASESSNVQAASVPVTPSRRRRSWQEHPRFRQIVGILTITATVLAWYFLTKSLIKPLLFPSPQAVWTALVELRGIIVMHAGITLYRVVASFVLGSFLGILVGLLMSRFKLVDAILDPIVEALRPVPPIALIPFFILWFGIGDFGKLLLSGLGCFMVLVVNTLVAVRNVPPIYLRAAASLGATKSQVYKTVIIPAITPPLVAGFRVAAALAFALTIAAELMGAQAGLGYLIMVARRSLNTDTILLSIILLSLLAWVVDQAIRLISDRLTHWTERHSD